MKIIKVIVSELPENCGVCTLHDDECCKIKGAVTGSEWVDRYSEGRDRDCPLEVV